VPILRFTVVQSNWFCYYISVICHFTSNLNCIFAICEFISCIPKIFFYKFLCTCHQGQIFICPKQPHLRFRLRKATSTPCALLFNAMITIPIPLRYDYDTTTIWLRRITRLLPFDGVQHEQKMNISVFRRSRIVVVSRWNRTRLVISITFVIVERVVVPSYRSRIVVESQLWCRLKAVCVTFCLNAGTAEVATRLSQVHGWRGC